MDLDNSKSIVSRNSKKKEIFVKAYDEYIDQIYRFIYFKIGNSDEAKDITSAVFLKTWNHIQKNKVKPKTLKALIYKIARNTVIDYYRGKNTTEDIDSAENKRNIKDENQDIHNQIETKFDIVLVEEKLMELKDEYREVIILRFTEELSISEIAQALNKTKGNTRVLIYRALKALREIIEVENRKQKTPLRQGSEGQADSRKF